MNIRNFFSTLCFVLTSMLVISGCTQPTGSIKCTLKGVVIDRPQSSRLILLKYNEVIGLEGIHIPINDGKFEYELNSKHEEFYFLIFFDEQPIPAVRFFSEHGVINFTLYPTDQFNNNIVEGGKLNKELRNYLNTRGEKSEEEINHWKFQYIKENQTTLGYWILWLEIQDIDWHNRNKNFQQPRDISPYVDMYQTIFAPKYPDHPYTEQIKDFLTGLSLEAVKAGDPFVDFIIPDLNGNPVRLSEQVAGKPTVLHLWASWCAPCRQKGKDLIPVYEEFRDKGFVVVGIARERGSSSAAEAAVELEKYPWKNLVELNDAEKIWLKYGLGNVAGGEVLIDEEGTIVAVNPSVDEIRDFLAKKLK